ncbi:MAG TPA: hypothetical protein V6D03_16180 [Candidatus Caenarcaniphilales bacterium]
MGEPTVATPEKGDCLWEAVSQGWAQGIKAVYAFTQPQTWQQRSSIAQT